MLSYKYRNTESIKVCVYIKNTCGNVHCWVPSIAPISGCYARYPTMEPIQLWWRVTEPLLSRGCHSHTGEMKSKHSNH